MQKAYGNVLINNLDHKIKQLTQLLEAVFLDLQLHLSARSAIMFTIKLYFPIYPNSPLYYGKDFCPFPIHIVNIRYRESKHSPKILEPRF